MNVLDTSSFIVVEDNILRHEHGQRKIGLTQSNRHIVCIVNWICSFVAVSLLTFDLCLPCLLTILLSDEMWEVWRGDSEGNVSDAGRKLSDS